MSLVLTSTVAKLLAPVADGVQVRVPTPSIVWLCEMESSEIENPEILAKFSLAWSKSATTTIRVLAWFFDSIPMVGS